MHPATVSAVKPSVTATTAVRIHFDFICFEFGLSYVIARAMETSAAIEIAVLVLINRFRLGRPEIVLPWQKDTEAGKELTQGRTRARARINLTTGGRGETAERGTETDHGRESQISSADSSGERDVCLSFSGVQREDDRIDKKRRG